MATPSSPSTATVPFGGQEYRRQRGADPFGRYLKSNVDEVIFGRDIDGSRSRVKGLEEREFDAAPRRQRKSDALQLWLRSDVDEVVFGRDVCITGDVAIVNPHGASRTLRAGWYRNQTVTFAPEKPATPKRGPRTQVRCARQGAGRCGGRW